MKIRNIRWNLMALGAFAALMSTSAHAVWTFGGYTNGQVVTPTNVVATTPYDPVNGTDPTVSLSGVTATNTSNVVSGTWSSASLISWGTSGLGMQQTGETVNGGVPNHAIDNFGKTEAVLLNFSSSVILSSIGLGWTSDGTCSGTGGTNVAVNASTNQCPTNTSLNTNRAIDLSVFRWVGTGTPPDLVGKSATANSGWELVGNYGDVAQDNTADYTKVNTGVKGTTSTSNGVITGTGGSGAAGAGAKGSSWWLISAYNSGFAQGTTTENRGTLDNGNDYFKLFAVAGITCVKGQDCGPSRVSEPASLALASVALLGVAGLRRRKAKTAI